MTTSPEQTRRIIEVSTAAEAATHFPDHYLRWETAPDAAVRCWIGLSAAVLLPAQARRSPWLTALGNPEGVLSLLEYAKAALPADLRAITVPCSLTNRLPSWLPVDRTRTNEWDWMYTYREPPRQAHEHRVTWLTATDAEIAELLSAASPRHSAPPGADDVVAWCGIRDDSGPGSGRLLACAAHTEHVAGVPHLASIATHPDARGQGLGSAVTAWLTRACLRMAPVATLGMYADNESARRIYQRLGYVAEHQFFSARLLSR